MVRDTILMLGNIEVLKYNLKTRVFEVFKEDLIPYCMKGCLGRPPINIKEDIDAYFDWWDRCKSAIYRWLSSRIILLSRDNAKLLYDALNVHQLEDLETKVKIATACRALSVLDNYWLKIDGESVCWGDVNVRHNSLNKFVTQIALHGSRLTIDGELITPEYTTNGTYAKAWRRYADGSLWLHKAGRNYSEKGAKLEVMVSNLLDKMNVKHVHYEGRDDEGVYVCACPCMSTDFVSVMSAMEFSSYCSKNNLDENEEMFRIDSESIYKMFIVDFLITNIDRHWQNWGFMYYPDTMEIIGCHPLFDHNCAFSDAFMGIDNWTYKFNGKPINEVALDAISKVDFKITGPITERDFMNRKQYESFMQKVSVLGLKIPKDGKKYKVNKNALDSLCSWA